MKYTLSIILILTPLLSLSQQLKHDWAKALGSQGYDYPYCVTLSNNKELYVVAYFECDSIYLNDSQNTQSIPVAQKRGTYLLKFDSTGTISLKANITEGNLIASSITTNINDEIIIAGNFKDTLNLNTINGINPIYSKGDFDFCIIKLNSQLNITKYKSWGDEYEDRVHDVMSYKNGSILLAGFISGQVSLDSSSKQNVLGTENNTPVGFVLKLNDQLEFEWSETMYNNDYVQCKAVTSDNNGNFYITGYFYQSLNLDTKDGTIQINGNGRLDIFVCKINPSGEVLWIKNWGDKGYDSAEDIITDANNNIYVAASFEVDPLLDNWHPDYYTKVLHNQAAILKINSQGTEQWLKTFAGPYSSSSATSITLDNAGNPIVAGYTTEGADMDPSDSTYSFSYNIEDYFNECGFIEAIDTAGHLLWATQFASKGSQRNNIYLAPMVLSDTHNNIYCANSSYKTENEGTSQNGAHNLSNVELVKLKQCFTTYITKYDTACSYYITPENDTLLSSGIFTENLTRIHTGCDSIVTWYITINPSYYLEKDTTIYEGTSMMVAGEHFPEDEVYTEYLTCDKTFCDSTVVWNITVSDSIIFNVINSEPACENSELTINYSLFSGIPNRYRIFFDDKALAAGFQNSSYATLASDSSIGSVTYFVPDSITGGIYTAYLQLKNSNGSESFIQPFTIEVNISSRYIHLLYEDLMMFDNSSERFVAYQWYKNGELIENATDQFYYDNTGSLGFYHVRAITNDGDTLITCPIYANLLNTDSKNITISPNPVPKGSKCTIKINGFINSETNHMSLTIKSITGKVILQLENISNTTTFDLPPNTGIYLGYITCKPDKCYYFKIIRN